MGYETKWQSYKLLKTLTKKRSLDFIHDQLFKENTVVLNQGNEYCRNLCSLPSYLQPRTEASSPISSRDKIENMQHDRRRHPLLTTFLLSYSIRVMRQRNNRYTDCPMPKRLRKQGTAQRMDIITSHTFQRKETVTDTQTLAYRLMVWMHMNGNKYREEQSHG